MNTSAGVLDFRLGSLPARQRHAAWSAFVCEHFLRLDLCESDFTATDQIQCAAGGAVHVARVKAGAHRVVRTQAMACRDTSDFVFMNLQLAGHCAAEQDGRQVTLTSGDFAIFDSTRPYSLCFVEPFSQLVIKMPRIWLSEKAPRSHAVTARPICGDGVLAALARRSLRALDAFNEPLEAPACAAVAQVALALALAELGHGDASSRRSSFDLTFTHAWALLREHACDSSFDPPTLAKLSGCSLRHLQAAFHTHQKTVDGAIWECRLALAQARLAQVQWHDCTVEDIAWRSGFQSASHFGVRFKKAFGQSPKSYRESQNQ